ncbi:hypothetical protein CPB83DRAFT_862054 [Crepidotus variabilis]|uniref:Uncharacterized protein n=1 Tax=Crepidotus variabilis TaxID=179855 RepID=A0A9P6JKM4_9AGAR|nr:hypothetical protein CPB83DRAFT_862054 [Crepidotus variabilis]
MSTSASTKPAIAQGTASTSAVTSPIPVSSPELLGKEIPSAKGRFEIAVESVYYYPEETSICAAVLLRTWFSLGNKQLKFANCPISVHALATDTDDKTLDIREYFPPYDERVQVKYNKGRKRWYIDPAVKAMEVEVSVGGYEKERTDHEATTISLKAQRIQRRPQRIEWHYKDSEESGCYPEAVDLLIVIAKSDPGDATWFEFQLKLTKDLKVDVHGIGWEFRFGGIPDPGQDGWHFDIRGQYRSAEAKKARESIKPTVVAEVGLKAAARSFLQSQKPPVWLSKSSKGE